jgi:hypothetical protein
VDVEGQVRLTAPRDLGCHSLDLKTTKDTLSNKSMAKKQTERIKWYACGSLRLANYDSHLERYIDRAAFLLGRCTPLDIGTECIFQARPTLLFTY